MKLLIVDDQSTVVQGLFTAPTGQQWDLLWWIRL